MHVVLADNYAVATVDHPIEKDVETFNTAEEAIAVARD